MITAFKPGSETAEMLDTAREAQGGVFADMLRATVNTKLQVQQMIADGADTATIDAVAEEAAVKLKAYLDATPGVTNQILISADLIIHVATLEDNLPQEAS